jgi:tetratricopeptide (TPR) repeat protein
LAHTSDVRVWIEHPNKNTGNSPFRHSRKLSRSFPDAPSYANLGTAYFWLKNYDQATKMLEKAVQIDASRDEELWGDLGDSYRFVGQTDKARAACRRALALAKMGSNAQSACALGDIGLLYAKIGDHAQAVQCTRMARAKPPFLRPFRDELGLAELFLESLPFAIQHHLVEGVGQRLAAGVGARFIGAGLDSGLRQL